MSMSPEQRKAKVLALRDMYLEMAKVPHENSAPLYRNEFLNLVKFASERSSFWQEYFSTLNVSAESVEQLLVSLPAMSRSFVQAHGQSMQVLIKESAPSDFIVHSTSGSSGQPVNVRKYVPTYFLDYDALTLLEWHWHDRDASKQIAGLRIGALDSDNDSHGPPLTYIGSPTPGWTRAVLQHSPAELLAVISEKKPAYIYVNSLMIRQLALAQLSNPVNKIHIDQFLSVSDPVDSSLRQLASDAFGAKICDRYSSEEFGYLALQCPVDNHLHIVQPLFHVEIVDEFGLPCPLGVAGRVLVTALHSFAMPLIRYEIGDYAIWAESCSAGISWPAISAIVGRGRDMFKVSETETKLATFVNTDILEIRSIRDFRTLVFQDTIVFLVNTSNELTTPEVERITKVLFEMFGVSRTIEIRTTTLPVQAMPWKRKEFEQIALRFNPNWTDIELIELLG